MEGETGAVFGICADGGGNGGECGKCNQDTGGGGNRRGETIIGSDMLIWCDRLL